MKVSSVLFGETQQKEPIMLHTLKSDTGMTLCVTDYGATIQSLFVRGRDGKDVDVVLGYDTLAEYQQGTEYLGACIGRCSNRIERGEFTLNGVQYHLHRNDGENHLHGGIFGFDKKTWKYRILENGICYKRISEAGEENYPGRLAVFVTYQLLQNNALLIEYYALTDQDTLCNLTNHSYFNLNGHGSIENHRLFICADVFGENDGACLPTGRLLPVQETPFDFRKVVEVGQQLHSPNQQLMLCHGFDHPYKLRAVSSQPAVWMKGAESGILMEVWTDQPFVQFYTANTFPVSTGKSGSIYRPYCAACFETQFFPNAMAYSNMKKPILRAGDPFHSRTVFLFSTE